jgi:hypothetical protein
VLVRSRFYALFFVCFSILLVVGMVRAHAADYTSTNFILRDPVIGSIGGFASSSNFQLFSSGELLFTDRTPSSGSYIGRFGFLYYPFVTQPTLAATAGDTEVDLSWSASDAGLGFTVSGYEYGVSTVSGGSYTFFNVGNVTSTTAASLTNDTQYYFVVRTLDAFGSPIITSNEVTATPTGGVTPPSSGGGGGSGFMGARFLGHAYPQAVVTILKNAVLRATAKADLNGAFTVVLQEEYDENVLYTLYADDIDGHRSLLLNYPLVGTDGKVTDISGIKFAPTITADKIATKQGEPVMLSGFALPNAAIEFILSASRAGGLSRTLSVVSNSAGRYELTITSSDLPKGEYEVRAHYPNDSRYSLTVQFTVGDVTIVPSPELDVIPGDCNADHKITLQDFSVLAYWYGKQSPPSCIDLNTDGTVNLVDFSILAYYWNG